MTIYLKQSTASQEVALGFFVDSTDGNTEETGLTIANTDIRLHKAGATTLANPSAGATHISNGIYYWVADATDTNTLGPMAVYCHPTGALAVRVECCVLAANVYDSLIGGGDILDVSTTQWLGTAVSTPTVAGVPNVNAKTWNDLTTVALPLVPTTAGRTLDVSATGEAGIDWANIGSPTTAVNLSATNIDVDQVVASVSGAVGSVTGLTASNLDAAVSTLATAANLATVAGYIDTEIGDIQSRLPAALVGGRMDSSVGAVAANAITAAGIADGAIDRATFAADTGMVSIRSNTAQAGASTSITLDASASAVTDFYKNDMIVLTGGTGAGQGRYCTAYNGTTKVATVSAWATNPDVTSTFAIIAADAIVGATAPTAVQVADEVQTRTIAAVTVVNGLAANVITAAATAADFTTEIQAGLATSSALATVAGYLDTEIADIQARLPAALVGGRMDSSVGAMASNVITAAATAADFSAEVADGILDRDMSTGTDSGSPTVRTMRQALRFLRNKWSISGTTLTVTKEDDTTASWTATVSTDAAALPVVGNDPA